MMEYPVITKLYCPLGHENEHLGPPHFMATCQHPHPENKDQDCGLPLKPRKYISTGSPPRT